MLWASLNHTAQAMVPPRIAERIRNAYSMIRQLENDVNPVRRVPLAVYRSNDNVVIEEMVEMEGRDGNSNQHPNQAASYQANEHGIQIMFLKLHNMDKKMDNMKESIEKPLL